MNTIPQNDASRKKCANPNCKNPWLPATPEFFHRSNQAKDGLQAYCKKCRADKQKAYLSRPEVQAKRAAYFSQPEIQERIKIYHQRPEIRARRKASRNRSEVKERIRVRRKAYRSRPEIQAHEQAYRKTYRARPDVQEHEKNYAKNYNKRPEVRAHARERDKIRHATPKDIARRKAYNNRPDVQERHRVYRANIRESKRIWTKNYYSRPEIKARYHAHAIHRRALKKSVQGTYTPAQIQELLRRQRYKCYYAACGYAKFEQRNGKYIYHIEHTYPLSRAAGTDIPANDISYIVLACPSCNLAKHDKLPHEWPEGGRLL